MQVTERFLTAWTAAEPAGGTGAPETRLAIGCTATGPLGFTLPKQAWLARRRGMSALDGQTALVTGSVILAAGRPATRTVPFPPCPQLRRRPPQSP